MPTLNEKIIQSILDWLKGDGLQVAAIIIGAFLVQKFAHVFIERFIRRIITPGNFRSKEAEKKREDTLIKIVSGTVNVVVIVVAALMVLDKLGIAVGPLIAAAGIAGLAFGFGGQYLIRDVIAGLFITLENQYRVGDVVCFDDTCGLVEDVSLRKTTLRDLDGTVHHVPHGEIKKVSNLSKDYARVNLDIGIAYHSDLEKVIGVINEVGKGLAEDPAWKNYIAKAPQFLRVNDFADSAIIVKILGETMPLKQWDVTGELRKRLKIAFDKNDIEIPFPQRVVHQHKQ